MQIPLFQCPLLEISDKMVVLADVPRYQEPERGCIQMFPGTGNCETALLVPLPREVCVFTTVVAASVT